MNIVGILNRVLTAFTGIIGLKTKLNIIPISDLDQKEGVWVSTGIDPAFLLEGNFFCGWNVITWTTESKDIIPVKLYWDDGSGFSEARSAQLPTIIPGVSNYKAMFHIPLGAKKLRLDPGEQEVEFSLENVQMKKITKYHILAKSIFSILKLHGINFSTIKKFVRKGFIIYKTEGLEGLKQKIKKVQIKNDEKNSYEIWLLKNAFTDKDIQEAEEVINSFAYTPLISVILPVYNVDEIWLRNCIDSVINQIYKNWELCISDDASTKPHIKKVLSEYAANNSQIKVVFREQNGHISENSNTALKLATGEFIALLDHDDELAPNALYEFVKLLNTHRNADMIYSDEDKIGIDGTRHSPFFKPEWSPDLILSQMYTSHLGMFRKSIVDELGGFRKGYEGSQDYDLVLRFTEVTNRIFHIPKVLYHWRTIPESTAANNLSKNYTHQSGLKALRDTLNRRKIQGWVEDADEIPNLYRVHYEPATNPKISIVIPNKNLSTIIDTCLQSIFSKTTYANYEVIVIDNGSDEQETKNIYDRWKNEEPEKFFVYSLDIPFNYSKINNFGVSKASGDLILLLNNDIEVITPEWLTEMAGQCSRPEVGAVGACLYYPDNTIQHAGIVLGIGGVAGHSHKHFNHSDYGYFSRLRAVCNYTAVTAACLMVKKTIYEEVGGLNEDLKVAFNDVDFCLKIWSKGYYNVWLPHVKLYHYESKSRGYEDTPEKQMRFKSEIDYMRDKWADLLDHDPNYNPNLTLVHEDYSIK
ncbi:glycosyl transferase family 2 [Paenibacillus faecis]|uniref:glycosyltransferase family 2 protein n=1 Tax=Paenibacillus faecis TaxID=862114 RepID=UPI001B293908|nr:glycosyltransferase family 2 protein [Paenibacillus faecis]GIO88501.1 glycosyl transferase family 2 [Paenibacillus faecis]